MYHRFSFALKLVLRRSTFAKPASIWPMHDAAVANGTNLDEERVPWDGGVATCNGGRMRWQTRHFVARGAHYTGSRAPPHPMLAKTSQLVMSWLMSL